MEDIIKVKINEFCNRLVKMVDIYCVYNIDGRAIRSYMINEGDYIVHDIIAHSIGIIRQGDEHLYWFYKDDELGEYILPDNDFINALVAFLENYKYKNTVEYKQVNKLTEYLEDKNIGF